jgi:hypothetical protein
VVADGQVLPVRQQRLGVGAEQPAEVRRVLLGGVEVDVVADLERQLHRHRGLRDQVRLDGVPVVLVADQVEQPVPGGAPGRAAEREERVQRRLREQLRAVQHLRGRDRCEVDELVADRRTHPRLLVTVPEHTERQVLRPERRTVRDVDPAHQTSIKCKVVRSARGSSMLQEPNDVNHRRVLAA